MTCYYETEGGLKCVKPGQKKHSFVAAIREQIELRRQLIWDEMDVLDKDERALSDPKIVEVIERYEGYLE